MVLAYAVLHISTQLVVQSVGFTTVANIKSVQTRASHTFGDGHGGGGTVAK